VNKIVGTFLIVLSLLALYFVFNFVVMRNLFVAWCVSLPFVLSLFVGLSPFLKIKVKTAIEGWFGFVLVTFIPWITVFPIIYQVLSVFFAVIMTILYICSRRRRKLSKQTETSIGQSERA
jgi:hypothetical protein